MGIIPSLLLNFLLLNKNDLFPALVLARHSSDMHFSDRFVPRLNAILHGSDHLILDFFADPL